MGRLLVGLVIILVLAGLAYWLFMMATNWYDSRDARAANKESKKLALTSKRQNIEMKSLLGRIAADDVGNAPLEARLLLEKFDKETLRQLEN